MLDFMQRHGSTLIANGFRILPLKPSEKAPGQFSRGEWQNYPDWQRHCDRPTTDLEVDIWGTWPGAGIGFACGATAAIDIDVPDASVAHDIEALARGMLGDTPLKRVGLAPKRALIYRAAEPFPSLRRQPLEILCHGAQLVAHGIHPRTGQPYTWPDASPAETDISDLPEITEAQAKAFHQAAWLQIPDELKPARVSLDTVPTLGIGAAGTSAWGLRGNPEAIRDALANIPNGSLERSAWIRVGQAIKGAIGDEGRDMFVEWSRRSPKSGKSGKPDTPEREWSRLGPSRNIGAGTIYSMAEEHGWRAPSDMTLSGDEPVDLSAFKKNMLAKVAVARTEADAQADAPAGSTPTPIAAKPNGGELGWLDRLDIGAARADRLTQGLPQPERFLLAPLMPIGTVGALFGEGGIGKSMVALELCLSVAGLAKAGDGNLPSIPGPLGGSIPRSAAGAAVFINLEDNLKSFHGRVHALDPDRSRDGAPFYYIAGAEIPDLDPAIVRADGKRVAFTKFAEHGIGRLINKVAADAGCPVRLLVLDPAGDFIDGPEDSADFVKPLMRKLRGISAEHDCTILLVGHTAKSGDGDRPTMRGSGAWVFNGRFAYALSRPERAKSEDKPDPRRHVWGELTKANHPGAPIGERRLFERDKSGRLSDVTAAFFGGAVDDEALVSDLVSACRKQSGAGDPFTRTGPNGLFERRAQLPDTLARLPRKKLRELSEAAVTAGLIKQDEAGFLAPPTEDIAEAA